MQPKYPVTKKIDHIDTYFGTQVADPYRWLEDDTSQETKQWVKQQNNVTFGYLKTIKQRTKIKQRLKEIWNYEKYSVPTKINDKYYYWKNDGLQNQSVLYVTTNLDDVGSVVLDPNLLSTDGSTSVSKSSFSADGKFLAYSISEAGSDWNTVRILDLGSLNHLGEELEWLKFSELSWYQNGFFYSRYPESNQGSKMTGKNQYHSLYYHKLGTSQADDKLIYVDEENPDRYVFCATSEDERFLIVYRQAATHGNAVSIAYLDGKQEFESIQIKPVVESFDNEFEFLGNNGDMLYFVTDYNAKKRKVIKINCNHLSEEKWEDAVPEGENTIDEVIMVQNIIFISYLKDVKSQLVRYDKDSNEHSIIDLPEIGTVINMRGRQHNNEMFFALTTFTGPAKIYGYNLASSSLRLVKSPAIDLKTEDFVTDQIFYTSKDGTKVSMFITHKKGLVMDGQNPCWLYGYGGFNASMTPSFSPSKIAFVEMGGIYCVANIRGGGEYGVDWYEAGTKLKKQNVFDDFIAASEYLIKESYTNPSKLIVEGASNGGLLVGACMTQRPDLFAVCLARVGVMDMLRYHTFTVGWGWARDYGTSNDGKEMFEYLLAYSPLHNLKPMSYPATLITTADHDDRVVPAHSFKFAAQIQQSQLGDKPVLIRIDTKAGHGAGKSTSAAIDEAGDLIAFALENISH